MPLETLPFDAADYLRTPAGIAEFLIVAGEENDPAGMAHALGIAARARRRIAAEGTIKTQNEETAARGSRRRFLRSLTLGACHPAEGDQGCTACV